MTSAAQHDRPPAARTAVGPDGAAVPSDVASSSIDAAGSGVAPGSAAADSHQVAPGGMRKLVAGVAWWALVVGLLVLVLLRWFHPLSQWAGCMREYPLRPAWCLHVPRDLEVKP